MRRKKKFRQKVRFSSVEQRLGRLHKSVCFRYICFLFLFFKGVNNSCTQVLYNKMQWWKGQTIHLESPRNFYSIPKHYFFFFGKDCNNWVEWITSVYFLSKSLFFKGNCIQTVQKLKNFSVLIYRFFFAILRDWMWEKLTGFQ